MVPREKHVASPATSETGTAEARSRKARASRDKGRRGELLAANKLYQLWATVERLAQDRGGHCDGPDIQVVEALLDVEVRHREESSISGAVKGAKANCRPGHTWAAVDWPTARGNRGPTITFDLDQWISFMQAERERAERVGFEAGQLSADRPKVSPPTRVGLVQACSLRDLLEAKSTGAES